MSELMAGFQEQFLSGYESGTHDTKQEIMRLFDEMPKVDIMALVEKRCKEPAFLKYVPAGEIENALQIIEEIIVDIIGIIGEKLSDYIDPEDPGAE